MYCCAMTGCRYKTSATLPLATLARILVSYASGMGDHLTVMFGYFLVKLSKPFCTRASSAGDDDHPVTLSVTLPDSALAADVFVLEGHASSGFFEPLTLAPVPPETLLPAPHPESSATSASAAGAPHSRRRVPLREP